jgi:hypothetical protein
VRPAVAAGGLTAGIAGGFMAVLTASAGGLAASLPAIVALTAALLAAGMLFGWLIETGRLRAGFGPGVLFWIAAFPIARLVQEVVVPGGGGNAGLSQGMAGFLVYQAMVGGAFGLGFLLLHNVLWEMLTAGLARRRAARDGDRRADDPAEASPIES